MLSRTYTTKALHTERSHDMKTAATKFAKVDFDWASIRAAVNFIGTDSVAVIQGRGNTLAWRPVFLRESDGEPHVRIDVDWQAISAMPGFLRYEKVHRRKYDTARDKVIEIA